jgi:hypothetical protein
MVPTIGILIAGYIFLRCLEILATIERVSSRGNRVVLGAFAVCVLLLSIYSVYALATASTDAGNVLRGLRP